MQDASHPEEDGPRSCFRGQFFLFSVSASLLYNVPPDVYRLQSELHPQVQFLPHHQPPSRKRPTTVSSLNVKVLSCIYFVKLISKYIINNYYYNFT